MTQYPSPYQPQSPYGYYGADPYADLKAPAKRAGILMIVLGGLLGVCGVCCVAAGPLLNSAQLDAETLSQFSQLESELGINVQTLLMVMGGLAVVPGLLLIVVSGLVDLARQPSPDTLLGLAMFVVILALFALLLFWLIQAARNAGKLSAMQAQYQMQYWQYQQQQQAYQQQTPPPSPPPPAQ